MRTLTSGLNLVFSINLMDSSVFMPTGQRLINVTGFDWFKRWTRKLENQSETPMDTDV